MISPKSPLEALPLEMLQLILMTLPSVSDLRSAALTCFALYNAFMSAESLITGRVLADEVGLDLLPEYAAVSDSLRLKSQTVPKIDEFVAEHLRVPRAPRRPWTLAMALRIGNLHCSVDDFATRFASTALTLWPGAERTGLKHAPPSHDEMIRIKSALCRLEIYRNIFFDPENDRFDAEQQRRVFFSHFPPWENEQLACIHDYLIDAVYPLFCEVAEQDYYSWGVFDIQHSQRFKSGHMQHLLFLGLARLQQIITVDFKTRQKLLFAKHPGYIHDYLNTGLRMSYRCDDESSPSPDALLSHVKSTNDDDESDSGPREAWSFWHEGESPSHWVNSDLHLNRQWGYVLWDRDRFNQWGMLETTLPSSSP
ncbi:MAG: hypothetical protein M4579_001456 [Chaenotheca gracillima]|nr:MAG: hypothetical protein M4579_001456 [Chaenotheca gracillima]